MRNLELEFVSAVPDIGGDYDYIDYSVSADGGGLFLYVRKEAVEKVYGRRSGIGGASFPKTSTGEKTQFALVHLCDGFEAKYELPLIDVTFPYFDVFPDGTVLIAGGRCRWKGKNDVEENGCIIDPVTGAVRKILLGDGIQDLFIDSAGKIWVSYFDEGVFGNFGWGGPGPEPVGASGLNCFNATGEVAWRFPGREIVDCYALNVARGAVYIYYYTGFPLCRIDRNHHRKQWETRLRGCSNIVLGEDSVLFNGQYDDAQSTAYLCKFSNDGLSLPEKVCLSLAGKEAFSPGKFVGRDAELHFCSDGRWFRLNLNDLTDAQG